MLFLLRHIISAKHLLTSVLSYNGCGRPRLKTVGSFNCGKWQSSASSWILKVLHFYKYWKDWLTNEVNYAGTNIFATSAAFDFPFTSFDSFKLYWKYQTFYFKQTHPQFFSNNVLWDFFALKNISELRRRQKVNVYNSC